MVQRWFYTPLKRRLIVWCDWLKSKVQGGASLHWMTIFGLWFIKSLQGIWIERGHFNIMIVFGFLHPRTSPCTIFYLRVCWKLSMCGKYRCFDDLQQVIEWAFKHVTTQMLKILIANFQPRLQIIISNEGPELEF